MTPSHLLLFTKGHPLSSLRLMGDLLPQASQAKRQMMISGAQRNSSVYITRLKRGMPMEPLTRSWRVRERM